MLTYLRVVQVDHLITMGKELNCSFYQSIQEYLVPVQNFKNESQEITVWQVNKKVLLNETAQHNSWRVQRRKNDPGVVSLVNIQNHIGTL